MRKGKIAVRVLLCLFLSAAVQISGIAVAARVHWLQWLVVFELPGICLGILMNNVLPKPSCNDGAWFCGLGQTLLVAALTDWLFWAAIIFVVMSVWSRGRAARVAANK